MTMDLYFNTVNTKTKRVVSLSEFTQYDPLSVFLRISQLSKVLTFIFVFNITAAGVVSCGDRKSLPVHHA